MHPFKSLFKNAAFSMFTTILNRLGNTILFVFIIQRLSVVTGGVYDLSVAYFLIFSRLAQIGLGHLLARDSAADKSQVDKLFSNFLFARIILSVIALGLAQLLLIQVNYDSATQLAIMLMLLNIIPENINELSWSLFAGHEEMHYSSLASFVGTLIKLSVGLLLLHLGYGLVSIILVILAGNTAMMIFNLAIVNERYVKHWRFPEIRFLRSQLPLALPFLFISAFYILDNRFDRLLLSFLSNEREIGTYAAAVAVIVALGIFAEAYRIAILPLLSRYRSRSPELFKELYFRSYKILLIVGAGLSIASILMAEDVISLIYRREMPEAVIALRILAITLVFVFLNALNTRLLLVHNKQYLTARFMVIAAIVNLLVNLWLIPPLGATGAAIGTSASIFLRFILISIVAVRLAPRGNLHQYVWRLAISTIITAIVIWLLAPYGFVLQGLVGATVYGLLLLITGTIDADERRILHEATLSRIK